MMQVVHLEKYLGTEIEDVLNTAQMKLLKAQRFKAHKAKHSLVFRISVHSMSFAYP